MIKNRIGGDFCEDAFGRDGRASKTKETLYESEKLINSFNTNDFFNAKSLQ